MATFISRLAILPGAAVCGLLALAPVSQAVQHSHQQKASAHLHSGHGVASSRGLSREAEAVFGDEEELPDAQNDGIDRVKAWADRRVRLGQELFESMQVERYPSPGDWADSVTYHLQADRFNNGNLDNDLLNIDPGQQWDMKVGNPANIPIWRHGGDIKGIQDRLGYMADLGINTLWVTPVLQHDGNYHAYCSTNPSTTDPGFGTPEELHDLVAEAHRHGIRFVLDIVVNHICDPDTKYSKEPDHVACPRKMNESHWLGGPSENEDQGTMSFGQNFFPPFRTEAFFSRCGPCEYEEMSDEGPGSVFGDFRDGMFDYDTRNKDFQEIFTNLMKFWVAYADIDAYRLDAAKHVTEDFIAYFSTEIRDFARSLGKENFLVVGEVATLHAEWQAMRLGRMMSDPADPSQHGAVPATLTSKLQELQPKYLVHSAFPFPGLNSVYNFAESGTGRDTVLGWRTGKELAEYFGSYKYNLLVAQLQRDGSGVTWDGHALSDDTSAMHNQLWTALELHDWPRILAQFPNRVDLSMLSLAWLFLAPGAPVVYAGLEQGFNGNCPVFDFGNETHNQDVRFYCSVGIKYMRYDAAKRQDMFMGGPWRLGSAVKSINDLANVNWWQPTPSPPWHEDPYLARNHKLYKTTRNLAYLRRTCRALTQGTMKFHEFQSGKHPFVSFSRISMATANRSAEEMVVMLNAGDESYSVQRVDLFNHWDADLPVKFVNVFNPAQGTFIERENGTAFLNLRGLQIAPMGMAVFVHDVLLREPYDNELGVSLCKSDWQVPSGDADDNGSFVGTVLREALNWGGQALGVEQ